MGKAVPRSVKVRVEALLEKFPDRFGKDFGGNKQVLDELGLSLSRFDRNMIAGFLTRKMNEKKE